MPKNNDELLKNKCEGFKECIGREPNVDLEECKDCLVEAMGVIFSAFRNDPEGK